MVCSVEGSRQEEDQHSSSPARRSMSSVRGHSGSCVVLRGLAASLGDPRSAKWSSDLLKSCVRQTHSVSLMRGGIHGLRASKSRLDRHSLSILPWAACSCRDSPLLPWCDWYGGGREENSPDRRRTPLTTVILQMRGRVDPWNFWCRASRRGRVQVVESGRPLSFPVSRNGFQRRG